MFLVLTNLVLVLLFLITSSPCFAQQTGNGSVVALFAFGDSILDTGNNNNLLSGSKCNYPPYGKDFPGGRATGRWGNGRVFSEVLAEAVGVKTFLPPYLDPALPTGELPTGVCFASGGSGLDTATSSATQSIPMREQLRYFQDYIGKLKGLVGEEKANSILANSLALISAGNNDMGIGRLASGRAVIGVDGYADLLMTFATDFVTQLYNFGVRKVAFMSAIPGGCTPAGRAATGGLGCAGPNPFDGASVYNTKLAGTMQALNSKLSGADIVYLDVYTPLLRISQNPLSYGFQNSMMGCCALLGPLCNIATQVTCPDRSKFVFWDSVHPTEAAYKAVIAQIQQKNGYKLF
ncbi:unnamed protein product [Linum tenue]|uniref:Uncharacterized protein n=1 Tax=Linum tenue TaxID=586396 RepID=A0AAV0HCA7_9ROSI|nr:unnamed protein product [Linum tenue]